MAEDMRQKEIRLKKELAQVKAINANADTKLSKNRELIEKGKELESKFALTEDEIEDIFDVLADEHPEL